MSQWLAASRFRTQYGRRLMAARMDAGLTQAELATQVGLSRSSVGNIEAGRQGQLAEQVMAAARAAHVDPRWLLTGWVQGTREPLDVITQHISALRKLADDLEQALCDEQDAPDPAESDDIELAAPDAGEQDGDASPVDDDPRLAQYEQERVELARAIERAVNGQYIGKPPPLLTGWPERAVSAVLGAGWLPPAAVEEMVWAEIEQEVLATLNEPEPEPEPQSSLPLPSPASLSRYLAENGWELRAREAGVREIWDNTRARARVMIPFATDYIDWERRWSDALGMIKTVNRWDDKTLALNLARYGR